MRASVLLIVIVGLFATSQAEFDFSGLKEIGKNLVGTLLQKGTEAIKTGLQGLLDKFGKRDLSHVGDFLKGIHSKLTDLVQKGKQLAGGAFSGAMDKLKAVMDKFHAKLGLTKSADDAKDAVDDIVAEHHVQHKRIIAGLIQKGKDLFGHVVQKVKDFAGSLKAKASELFSGLLQKGSDMLVGKRATLSDHLKTVGGVLSKIAAPFKDIVAGLGSTLKGHFSSLVDKVKGHYNALKGKLSGHVADLKTHGATLLKHGKNALGALGEVVKDILGQTFKNAKPAIDGLVKTVGSAGGVVAKHIAGN